MSEALASAAVGRRIFSVEVEAEAGRCGETYGVPGALHPDDFVFWFIHDQPHMVDGAQAVREYFESGKEGALFVQRLLDEYRPHMILEEGRRSGQRPSLLEFASGYGRVTRHFAGALPGFDVVACDIHPQAVQFLRSLGLQACESTHMPEDMNLGRQFDVIYAFSFFTHMPRSSWTRWLKALERHLAPNGLLIFSTHGKFSQRLMGVAEVEPDGFFFHAVSEQKDLALAEYGNTVTTFDYVYRQVDVTKLNLVQFREAGAGHHDFYILHKDAPGRVSPDEVRLLKAQIQAIYRSHSWKITSPLRALSRALTGRP